MAIDYGQRVFWWGKERLLLGDVVRLARGAPGMFVRSIGINSNEVHLRVVEGQHLRYGKAQRPKTLELQPQSDVNVEEIPPGTELVLDGEVMEVVHSSKTTRQITFDTMWGLVLKRIGAGAVAHGDAIEFKNLSVTPVPTMTRSEEKAVVARYEGTTPETKRTRKRGERAPR